MNLLFSIHLASAAGLVPMKNSERPRDCNGFLTEANFKPGIEGPPPELTDDFLFKILHGEAWHGLYPRIVDVPQLRAALDTLWRVQPKWAGPGFSVYEAEFEFPGAGSGWLQMTVHDYTKTVLGIEPLLFQFP